jgi:signal transduction histidine kinase
LETIVPVALEPPRILETEDVAAARTLTKTITSASGLAVRAIVRGHSGDEAAEYLGHVVRAQRRIVAELPSSASVTATAAHEAMRLARAMAARVEMVDGSDLVCTGAAGSDVERVGARSPLDAIAKDCLLTGEPRRRPLPGSGVHELTAPLTYRGHRVGLLSVRGAAKLRDADGHMLSLIAAVTGDAVGTAHEHDLRDRMASLGRLAAGMAHEVATPVTYISANVGYVLEALAEAGDGPIDAKVAREALEDARRGVDRVAAIVAQLRVFSRSPLEGNHRVDVGDVLREMVKMVAHEIRAHARLVESYVPVSPVLGNEVQIGQVFLNLLLNAAQAIPRGREGARVEARVLDQIGGNVVVEISDTGAGIAPENIARVFDPFFTTKPLGTGTGLGLSISQGIVRAHGGEITVTSEPGRGCTFRVTLPAAGEVSTTTPGPPTALRDAIRSLIARDDRPSPERPED